MIFYVEKWVRFIDFTPAYAKLISKEVNRTNKQAIEGEIVFSQHVIPV